eukprot:5164742-Pyramimonas_sp.AAC.1
MHSESLHAELQGFGQGPPPPPFIRYSIAAVGSRPLKAGWMDVLRRPRLPPGKKVWVRRFFTLEFAADSSALAL